MKRPLSLVTALAFATFSLPAFALDVAVTIKPLHSLVAGVMSGVGEPTLIVGGAGSPHDYHLRPSDAQNLQQADVIFWIGDELETFMESPLKSLGQKATVVAMEDAAGLHMIKNHDETDDHKEEEHHDHDEHEHHHGEMDMHLWLDPQNAKAMVGKIAQTLIQRDPQHKAQYSANAEKMHDRLDQMAHDIGHRLESIHHIPFVVFHDAYAHFEYRFRLNIVANVTLSPERMPGAKHLGEVRHTIQDSKAVCVFSEPQFQPKLVHTVIEGSNAKAGQLDPLGATLEPGADMYFKLMDNIATSLESCLKS
ncbi:MAG: zinc ABC transporter substrate-binding protein ZnuA [Terasakiella sp.]|uniref:zinc ABC transporter substrate-binding protein ZnuA n=1 Tax=unclassified Terasakiella TaxID=2614952 RepID=UPI003AFF62BF